MDTAFDTDDCKLLETALGQAWTIFLRTGRLTVQNRDIARTAITYALMDTFQAGERNATRLAIRAVERMGKFEGKLLFARSLSRRAEIAAS